MGSRGELEEGMLVCVDFGSQGLLLCGFDGRLVERGVGTCC